LHLACAHPIEQTKLASDPTGHFIPDPKKNPPGNGNLPGEGKTGLAQEKSVVINGAGIGGRALSGFEGMLAWA
jgi:hypothetical protein